MKSKLVYVGLLCVSLISCNNNNNVTPNQNNGNNNNNNPNTTNVNKITVVDNGSTYVAEGHSMHNLVAPNDYVDCDIIKGTSFAVLYAQVTDLGGTNKYQFDLAINGSEGPLNGLGTFTKVSGYYTEKFSGGESYEIVDSTSTANVTINSGSKIQGTFTLNLANSQHTKTVTGTLDINDF